MSISLLLVPVAIALVATVGGTAAVVSAVNTTNTTNTVKPYAPGANKTKPVKSLAPIQTIFTDQALLEQTLREHGLSVEVVSGTELVCYAGSARLRYVQETAGEPFIVTVTGVDNVDRLKKELKCFEQEYMQNVQSFTYNQLVKNMDSNMKITEEVVLEDNSLLLTIDVE